MAKAQALLKAYQTNTIPPNGGFIISAKFQPGTAYAIYEITAYCNVKDTVKTQEGLMFKTDGNRTHMLIEPATFAKKHIEPVNRDKGFSIPYRMNELTVIDGNKSEKIMIGQEPQMLYTSFTIIETRGESFTFIFHPTKDVYIAIKKFIADSLYNDCKLTKNESLEAAKTLLETIKKFIVWEV